VRFPEISSCVPLVHRAWLSQRSQWTSRALHFAGQLERFVTSEAEINFDLRGCFAGLWGLTTSKTHCRCDPAIDTPEDFVFQAQRVRAVVTTCTVVRCPHHLEVPFDAHHGTCLCCLCAWEHYHVIDIPPDGTRHRQDTARPLLDVAVPAQYP
jgi:hypothetical protein